MCVWVMQSITVERYPAELSLATMICSAGALQGTAVALVAERHSRSWAVGWDYRLYAPLYTVCPLHHHQPFPLYHELITCLYIFKQKVI